MAGQRVAVLVRQHQASGGGEFVWDGRDGSGRRVASGIYLYRLSLQGEEKSARMLVLR